MPVTDAPDTTLVVDLAEPRIGPVAAIWSRFYISLWKAIRVLDHAAARKAVLAFIVSIGFLGSVLANWPGHFEPDSLWQLAQGRIWAFNSWHPPVMAFMLGVAERISHGAPLFFVFDSFIFYGSLLALSLLEPRPRIIALPIMVVMCASPLALIYQGVVWKDVLFADSALAGFTALAFAARLWGRAISRILLLVLAFLLFSLAALSRQNGLIIPLCGSLALAAIAWKSEARTSLDRRTPIFPMLYSGTALLLSLTFVFAAGNALEAHSDHVPENLHQLKRLQVYDLAGMTHMDPQVRLPVLSTRAPDLEAFIRGKAAPHFQKGSADNLETLPAADIYLIPAGYAGSAQWFSLIAHHPLLYLRERALVFYSVLATPKQDLCPTVFAGIDNSQSELLRDAGLSGRYNSKDAWDDKYATAFMNTPVFSHIFYGALVLVSLGLSLYAIARGEGRAEHFAIVSLCIAALLFVASFFVISMACDYRYLYFLDVAALGSVVFHAAASRGHRRPERTLGTSGLTWAAD